MINDVTKGKFIVLDGGDGSGKGTQLKLLFDKLVSEGIKVKVADFPQYGKWSAVFVEKYLRGEFGGLESIGAKKGSLFYAMDRYAASFDIRKWLDEGFVVLSNRYVSANKGHQLGKISDDSQKKEFLDWLNEMEYSILEIPKPDLTLFLHMPAAIGQKLVDKKGHRDYVGGEKRDIHEADIEHLENAEKAFLYCLEHDSVENWVRIECSDSEKPDTIESIQEKIYVKVKELLEN